MIESNIKQEDKNVEVDQEARQESHRFILDFGSSIATLDTKSNVLTFVSPSGVVNGNAYIPASSFSLGDAGNISLLRDVISNYYPVPDKSSAQLQVCQDRIVNMIEVINEQQSKLRDIVAEKDEVIAGCMKDVEELRSVLASKDAQINQLDEVAANATQAMHDLEQKIIERDNKILIQSNDLECANDTIQELKTGIADRDSNKESCRQRAVHDGELIKQLLSQLNELK